MHEKAARLFKVTLRVGVHLVSPSHWQTFAIVGRAIRSPPVIEDAEIELSLALHWTTSYHWNRL